MSCPARARQGRDIIQIPQVVLVPDDNNVNLAIMPIQQIPQIVLVPDDNDVYLASMPKSSLSINMSPQQHECPHPLQTEQTDIDSNDPTMKPESPCV